MVRVYGFLMHLVGGIFVIFLSALSNILFPKVCEFFSATVLRMCRSENYPTSLHAILIPLSCSNFKFGFVVCLYKAQQKHLKANVNPGLVVSI